LPIIRPVRRTVHVIAIALTAVLVTGCERGTISVWLTDAPADEVSEVLVDFERVDLIRADGGRERFQLDPPLRVDLRALEGGLRVPVLDERGAEEGEYSGIHLFLARSSGVVGTVTDSQAQPHDLVLTGGDGRRIEIAHAFRVRSLRSGSHTIDIDLRRALRAPLDSGDPYRLDPAGSVRAVEDSTAGDLSGVVDNALIDDPDCEPAVYLYEGNTAGSGLGSAAPPFASTRVRAEAGVNPYHLAFLPNGNYTAALTCDAGLDDPEDDVDITFERVISGVPVRAGQTTGRNFQ
jgi:hypothetical protein